VDKSASYLFLFVWVIALVAWFVALFFFFHRAARRYYKGPTGLARFGSPFARYSRSNYNADGYRFVRRELFSILVLAVACAIGMLVANLGAIGRPH
jgi:hypothetical protein